MRAAVAALGLSSSNSLITSDMSSWTDSSSDEAAAAHEARLKRLIDEYDAISAVDTKPAEAVAEPEVATFSSPVVGSFHHWFEPLGNDA